MEYRCAQKSQAESVKWRTSPLIGCGTEVSMKFSKKATAIEPSLTRKLFNLAKNYDDVVDLTLGDPDIPPSALIKDAACEAVQAGKT